MLNFLRNFAHNVATRFIVNGLSSLSNYMMGYSSAQAATSNLASSTARSLAVEAGALAANQLIINALPGGAATRAIAQVATQVTREGATAAIDGSNISRGVAIGVICGLNTVLMGPVAAIPANMITPYLVNRGADVVQELNNIGIAGAYNNYLRNDEYLALPLCNPDRLGPKIEQTEVQDEEDENFSFIRLDTCSNTELTTSFDSIKTKDLNSFSIMLPKIDEDSIEQLIDSRRLAAQAA